MCMVCADLIKQSLTISEAERNLGELIIASKENYHYQRLLRALEDLDLEDIGFYLSQYEKEKENS